MHTQSQGVRDRSETTRSDDVVGVLAGELSRDERLIVILHYADGLEVSEIAATLRCDEARVHLALGRVQSRMRELLVAARLGGFASGVS